ncbi:major facilitator superfamily domain-containing protein [Halteromyces radiatus]|uniref:major facilitator superfamily domain-containing protein n=1 Tax=Halteromyces radiatus TaxID=101107 RepID=UPI00221E8EFD|nr:major facilitator superfamily domain-containing protein [Halteromyces radiatus]KAI8093467.1 major facilitator superfamily domain-containing protein [Halteromyces radiatus]
MLKRKPSHLALSFIMALLVASVSGPQYIFPTYGTSLATKFHWTALENSLVSTACFLGVSFSGPLCSWMIERLGSSSTLRVAACFGFFGNFLLAQTYIGRLPSHFQLCAIYLVLTGFASAAAYICALENQSYNFRHHRGMAMGFTSAVLGLCGLIFSQINDHFFKNNPNGGGDENTYEFLMFLSVVTAAGMLIPSFILGPLSDDKKYDDEDVIYRPIYPSDMDLDDDGCSSHPTLVDDDSHDDDDDDEFADTPLLANNINYNNHNIKKPINYAHDTVEVMNEQQKEEEESISGLALFTHPVSLTLFVALFVVLGIGYVYLASIGQILLSLTDDNENPQHVRNIHVSLFSISNCTARAVFGTLSDILKNRYGIHRLWVYWMGIVGLILSQLYLVTLVSSSDTLIPCTVTMALVYGLAFGIAPAAAAEFGTNVSTFYTNTNKIQYLYYM